MKRPILTLIILATILCLPIQAQQETVVTTDSIAVGSEGDAFVPNSWEIGHDSILKAWHTEQHFRKMDNPAFSDPSIVSDSVYMARLAQLNCIIEVPYGPEIRQYIDLYVDRRRSLLERMLGLENLYFPMIEQALDENNLPDELKYLSIVESALNPVALSRVGAAGLWQFMLPTAKIYGMEINSLVDERRDPLIATYAACEYFKDMYRIYNDWTLCIAAYNCGSGNVNKAIRRAGGTKDFWKIYQFLPKETRVYVPLFVAVMYAMNYYAEHQIYPEMTDKPIAVDTVMVNRQLHFYQVAEVLDMNVEAIRSLNPQYKQDIIPGNSKPRALTLPALKAVAYAHYEDSIAHHRADDLFANLNYLGDGTNKQKITHVVARGENLNKIGDKYGVTAANIRKWNGLRSNTVSSGRRLTIYIDNGGFVKTATDDTTASKSTSEKPAPAYGSYKVKKGDTYSSIALKYKGYSAQDLMRLNNTTKSSLREGQVIKVPK